jgi:hypothetical protein
MIVGFEIVSQGCCLWDDLAIQGVQVREASR